MKQKEEICLQGIPISRGIAIGLPFLFSPSQREGNLSILPSEVDFGEQIKLYQAARMRSFQDVQWLRKQLQEEGALSAAALLEAQEHILQDPLFTHEIEEEIQKEKRSAKDVFSTRLSKLKEWFSSLSNAFMQDRFRDIEDVANRLLHHLEKSPLSTLADAPPQSVVFAAELTTSDTASAKTSLVSGFVTQGGSLHSHAAIVAKAKGIPYVGGVQGEWEKIDRTQPVIIDGRAGRVILNPSQETLQYYHHLQNQIHTRKKAWLAIRLEPSQTADEKLLLCTANVETVQEAKQLADFGAEGVGLFRSEFLLFGKNAIPSEEEQYWIYCKLIEATAPRPLTVRVFDIRGDKFLFSPLAGSKSLQSVEHSQRFLQENPQEGIKQLRALLRAAVHGKMQILFPMICSVEEFIREKENIARVREELQKEGVPHCSSLSIGAMIELPSAAITADLIAEEADFLAIGTNDLLQYATAQDRGEHKVHPFDTDSLVALIRFLQVIVLHGHAKETPVKLCGDIASDPRLVPLLIGLEIDELSVPLRSAPLIKHIIRQTEYSEAKALAREVLRMQDGKAILRYLTELYQQKFPEDYFCSFSKEKDAAP